MAENSQESDQSKLSIAIKDKAVLYAAYMPFLKSGGLFIPTKKQFKIGDVLSLILTITDLTEQFTVDAEVVWITPAKAQGNRAPGIGVQFLGNEGSALRAKIESILGGALKSDKPTHTL